jgi:hypothetical protein
MVACDAGTYEVKISSISYDLEYNISPDCDSLVLPLLENTVVHAPVTFTVQENHVPVYDPSSVITTQYVANNTRSIELRNPMPLSSSLLGNSSYYSRWHRNGTLISGGSYNQEGFLYNNTDTVVGDFVEILSFHPPTLRSLCEGYYYYYSDVFGRIIFYYGSPIQFSFWNIKYYSEFEAQYKLQYKLCS